jgi:hypothetical protein
MKICRQCVMLTIMGHYSNKLASVNGPCRLCKSTLSHHRYRLVYGTLGCMKHCYHTARQVCVDEMVCIFDGRVAQVVEQVKQKVDPVKFTKSISSRHHSEIGPLVLGDGLRIRPWRRMSKDRFRPCQAKEVLLLRK